MDLTVSSFFHYYMFEPTKADNPVDRTLAMITTVALGILSLGIAHLVCYFAFFNRTVVKVNETTREQGTVDDVYRRIIEMDVDTPSVSSWERSSDDESDSKIDDEVIDEALSQPGVPDQGSPHVMFKLGVDDSDDSEHEGIVSPGDPQKRTAGTSGEIQAVVDRSSPVKRESRLVRFLSERRLKKEKKQKKQKKNGKELNRTHSLKNLFSVFKHRKKLG